MVSIWRPQQSRRLSRQQFNVVSWFTSAQWALGWAIILVTLAIAGGIFLAQVSRTALAGRSAQLIGTQLNEVLIRNSVLERELAEAQSLSNLSTRTADLGLNYELVDLNTIDTLDVVIFPPDSVEESQAELPIPPFAVEEAIFWWAQDKFFSAQ